MLQARLVRSIGGGGPMEHLDAARRQFPAAQRCHPGDGELPRAPHPGTSGHRRFRRRRSGQRLGVRRQVAPPGGRLVPETGSVGVTRRRRRRVVPVPVLVVSAGFGVAGRRVVPCRPGRTYGRSRHRRGRLPGRPARVAVGGPRRRGRRRDGGRRRPTQEGGALLLGSAVLAVAGSAVRILLRSGQAGGRVDSPVVPGVPGTGTGLAHPHILPHAGPPTYWVGQCHW